MSKKFSVRGWQIKLGWQGMTLTPPEQVDRYREVKLEAPLEAPLESPLESWMQAADVFTPGGMLFAPVPVRRRRERVRHQERRRIR